MIAETFEIVVRDAKEAVVALARSQPHDEGLGMPGDEWQAKARRSLANVIDRAELGIEHLRRAQDLVREARAAAELERKGTVQSARHRKSESRHEQPVEDADDPDKPLPQ